MDRQGEIPLGMFVGLFGTAIATAAILIALLMAVTIPRAHAQPAIEWQFKAYDYNGRGVTTIPDGWEPMSSTTIDGENFVIMAKRHVQAGQ